MRKQRRQDVNDRQIEGSCVQVFIVDLNFYNFKFRIFLMELP